MIVFDRGGPHGRRDGGTHGGARRSRPAACPANERGVALIAVLLMMLVSLAIGLLSANTSRTELAIAHNQVLDLRALAVAEAGISMAKQQIEAKYAFVNKELALNAGCTCATSECNYGVGASGSGLEAIGGLVNATFPDDIPTPRCYRFASFGGSGSDGYYLRVEDNLDEPTGLDNKLADVDQAIRVTSHGVVGTAVRTIVATFNLTPGTPGGPGLCARDRVLFSGGGGVADSYSGTPPSIVYGAGAMVASNVLVQYGDALIYGDVVSGGTVTGNNPPIPPGTVTTGAPAPCTYAPVAACGPPFSGSSGINTGGGTYNTSTGALTCGSSGCALAPGTYCFGEVKVQGGASLTVTGPTVVNTTNKFTLSGGGLLNTTGDASNFQLYSSYVGNGALTSSGTSASFMQFYGPSGNVVVSGTGGYYGTLIAAKAEFTGGSKFHQYGGGGGGTPGVVDVTSWHEVQH